ncbi:MAG: hypothetical protein H0U65_10835 [Rubrobacter sp.]|jgi:hypothetical protein|nr:hypothetical protein [Rubrobacter sp.]
MSSLSESCLHLDGFRVSGGSDLVCPGCGARLDAARVAEWVRDAERERDEAYSLIEGDEFGEIVREERQQEVYRRRKVMYELKSVPRIETARPEMILVAHDPGEDAYECRIFYKEPRPEHGMDHLTVEANMRAILELKSDPSPVVRTAARKVEEFHLSRMGFAEDGGHAPGRRVFYASDL